MRIAIYLISFIFIMLQSICIAHAHTLYRHVPFSISAQPHDQIIVNYDFHTKQGVHCLANNNHVGIDFYYKGRLKTDGLPIFLESDHIPANETEALADSIGQFTLSIDQNETRAHRIEIHCDYNEQDLL